jgi:hypothetical protein
MAVFQTCYERQRRISDGLAFERNDWAHRFKPEFITCDNRQETVGYPIGINYSYSIEVFACRNSLAQPSREQSYEERHHGVTKGKKDS